MKANQEKSHLLSSFDIRTKFWLPACMLEKSASQRRLSVTSERKLNLTNMLPTYVVKQEEKLKYLQEFSHIYPKHKNNF